MKAHVLRRYVAAYLLDRAAQYDTSRWEPNPLTDAAIAMMNGDFDAAVGAGELDDLLPRVARIVQRRGPATPPTEPGTPPGEGSR